MEDVLELEEVSEFFKLIDKPEKDEVMCVGSVTEVLQNSDRAKIKIIVTIRLGKIIIKYTELVGECLFLLPNTEEYKLINKQRQEVIDEITLKTDKRKTELLSIFEKKGFTVVFGVWSI